MAGLNELIRSKRFWTMVLGAVVSTIIATVPGLEDVREELLQVLVVIVGLVIGGYTLEDTASAFRHGPKAKYKPGQITSKDVLDLFTGARKDEGSHPKMEETPDN